MGGREAEDRERAVTLEAEDVTIEARLDDLAARVAVSPQQLAIRLRLGAPRELGRPADVALHDREPAKLAPPCSELVPADPVFLAHVSRPYPRRSPPCNLRRHTSGWCRA